MVVSVIKLCTISMIEHLYLIILQSKNHTTLQYIYIYIYIYILFNTKSADGRNDSVFGFTF